MSEEPSVVLGTSARNSPLLPPGDTSGATGEVKLNDAASETEEQRNNDFTCDAVEAGVTNDGPLCGGDFAGGLAEAGVTDDGSLRSGDFTGVAVEAGVTADGSLRSGDIKKIFTS